MKLVKALSARHRAPTGKSLFNLPGIGGYRQVTDVYLPALARRYGGCLATFDTGIPLSAVIGATRHHLAVITAGR
jgi:hypothetical protein